MTSSGKSGEKETSDDVQCRGESGGLIGGTISNENYYEEEQLLNQRKPDD